MYIKFWCFYREFVKKVYLYVNSVFQNQEAGECMISYEDRMVSTDSSFVQNVCILFVLFLRARDIVARDVHANLY